MVPTITKLAVTATVAVVLSAISPARADYVDPPGWDGDTDFTHQSWDFLTDQSGSLPAEPDSQPAWSNPFGTSALIAIDYSEPAFGFWVTQPMGPPTDRRGVYGGMGNTTLTFHIPNNPRPEPWTKQIWIQMAYWAGLDMPNCVVEIARDINFTDTSGVNTVSEVVEEITDEIPGSSGRWYRLTGLYEFDDQPGQEYIRLSSLQGIGAASMIDQVDIDTRCVIPEPLTAMLLLTGGLAGLAVRRQRH